MALAHLRGLLKPYYVQGTRSVIAETAMLRALAAEIVSNVEGQMLLAEASFAPLLSPGAAKSVYQDLHVAFHNVLDKAMLEATRVAAHAKARSQDMVALHEDLEKSGFYAKLHAEADKIIRTIPRKR